ncbi:MAG: hypothetical protein ACTHOK_02150 [Nocardioidaceae bacterium]
MSASRVASGAAALGGIGWVAGAALGWGSDAPAALYLVGLLLALLALAALGYSLVATAPVWLRAVVTVATPALGYMVWVTVRDAFAHDYVPVAVAGLLLLAAGGVGLSRRDQAPPAVTRGRRAAR